MKGGRPNTAGLASMSPAAQRLVSAKLGNITLRNLLSFLLQNDTNTVHLSSVAEPEPPVIGRVLPETGFLKGAGADFYLL